MLDQLSLFESQSCNHCKQIKSSEGFSIRNDTGTLRRQCKLCLSSQRHKYYLQTKTDKLDQERQHRLAHPEQYRISHGKAMKKLYQKLRRQVLKAYGNRCACCGESMCEFLTIDHIDGIKEIDCYSKGNRVNRRLHGYDFYNSLKKRGFPTDNYQILCFNCNCAKGIYKKCPHKLNDLEP